MLIAIVSTLVGLAGAAASLPQPTRSGDVQVVEVADPGKPLFEGGSTGSYAVVLPSGASCPGDSANDDYRYQGYLVPEGLDPATIRYNSVGPVGTNEAALFRADTDALIDQFTIANDVPGEPGVLPPIPPLSFNSYVPGFVAAGNYRLGIACTYFGTTTNYWDIEVRISADASDEPANVHWVVLSAPTKADSHSVSSTKVVVWLLAGVAVVVVGGVLFARLRKPSSATTD
jgi:hypothetical protein